MTTSLPPAGRRGPRQPLTIDPGKAEQLLAEGRELTATIAAGAAAVPRRREVIAALKAGGFSVRQIAEGLDVAPAVVQDALKPRKRATARASGAERLPEGPVSE